MFQDPEFFTKKRKQLSKVVFDTVNYLKKSHFLHPKK